MTQNSYIPTILYASVSGHPVNKSYCVIAMDRPGPVYRTAYRWTGPESDRHLLYRTTCGQVVRSTSPGPNLGLGGPGGTEPLGAPTSKRDMQNSRT